MKVLLIALCLALGGAICIEAEGPSLLTAPVAVPPPTPARGSQSIDRADAVPTVPSFGSLTDVVNRPLFAETRRPAPPGPRAAGQSPGGLALVGVVLSDDAARALIAHGQPSRLERVAEGQEVDGWTVDSIRLDRVVLRRAGQQAELRVSDARSSSGIAPPAAAPARDPAAEHALAVQTYMDAHGGMLPPEAQ